MSHSTHQEALAASADRAAAKAAAAGPQGAGTARFFEKVARAHRTLARRCFCPLDCHCRDPHRTTICGCQEHTS